VESEVVVDESLNYAQPLEAPAIAADAPMPDDASVIFDAAQASFYNGGYSQALAQVEKALVKLPQDAALHEFRALCLFALKRYNDAAGNLHAVLAVAPGWDWKTMSGLYPSVDVYTTQLRNLEGYVRANPEVAEGRFVLAYHYLTAGYKDEASKQLEKVVKLSPRDEVSKQLLGVVDFDPVKDPPPLPKRDTPPAAAPKSVVGSWTASSGTGAVEMELRDDGSFKWMFSPSDKEAKPKDFTGKYQLAGSTLVLEYDTGGTMVAKVSEPAAGELTFRMVNGPANDPGLSFRKK
jgi:tetratricopeptide (TPR) repeat protein